MYKVIFNYVMPISGMFLIMYCMHMSFRIHQRPTIQSYCAGMRTNTRRTFQGGAKCIPPFLIMSTPSTPSGFLLSHFVYIFEKILHSIGLYPLISCETCECRIIYEHENIDNESRFHCCKKSNICQKKNSCRGVHLKKKFLHKRWATKKIRAKWKFPPPLPITFLMVRL